MNSRMDKFYNIMTRTIMFISSYFPLYIMIIILYFSKITKAFLEKNILIIVFATLMLILIFISVISVTLLKLGKGNREKGINNLENPDDTVLSYIMTYIIPLITNGDNSKEVYIVNILLFVLIGYIIYRDANKEIVITNISREVLRHKEKLKGYYISNDIFVAHKKDN